MKAHTESIHEPRAGLARRRVTILGATGSIGRSTAQVIRETPGRFEVEAVAGGRDALALARTAIELGARIAVVAAESAYDDLRNALEGTGIACAAGRNALKEAASRPVDVLVGAITGAAGVEPVFAALGAARAIALANKETLVCAGGPFMRAAARAGASILPMDSEHNAIFQALGGAPASAIERMILTASGGPFRTWSHERIAQATPEQALMHPNWQMGPKVTVDSAGLMNKGLELIEAHHVFAVTSEKLDVLVHPQSIVHGLVSFADGALVAGLSHPDMKVPIAHCLGYPGRIASGARRLDLAEVASLTFERPDFERFPALALARDMLAEGGAMPTVLNAANEIVVAEFLNRAIAFPEIAGIVRQVCEVGIRDGLRRELASMDDALVVDHIAREMTRTVLAGQGRSR